jgi:hypothetical protein
VPRRFDQQCEDNRNDAGRASLVFLGLPGIFLDFYAQNVLPRLRQKRGVARETQETAA